jgi:predicted glycoside hydrolase/deacetylase ChbG (UPF0249 family)
VSRHVIFNADDLGLSEGINRGIAVAHAAGVVTSASLMVTGPAARDAAKLAREHPRLSIGLHWDVWGEEGRAFPLEDPVAVRDEFERQLTEFVALLGRPPTHVDSHQHAHREGCAAEVIRELVAPLGVPLRGDGAVACVGGFYAQWEWRVTDLRHVSLEFLSELLHHEVGERWTEVSCHPGYLSPDYGGVYGAEREAELRTLTDPRLTRVLEREGIHLGAYGDLARHG